MTLINEMTDLEAIEYCIKMGVDAHRLLKTYRNKDRLSDSRSVASLQKLLTTIHEDVHLLIDPKKDKPYGGQKRRHVVGALRDEAIPKEDKRTENLEGQPPTATILLMSEYIHNQLYNMQLQGKHMEYGSNGWTKQLGILQKDKLPIDMMEKRIRELHTDDMFYVPVKPSKIVREFASAIYGMSTDIPKKCFEILRKSGHIEYVMNYNLKSVDNKKEIIEKELFDEIRSELKLLLEELGSSVYEYNKAIENPTEKMKPIIQKIEEMLVSEYECKFVYKSYEVLDVVECDSITSKNDFMEAYWDEFIRRTKRRQQLYDNKYGASETWLWRKMWLFHACMLIEYMGHDVAGNLLSAEIEKPVRMWELSVAFKAWQDSQKPVGFGTGFIVEDSPEDIEEVLDNMFLGLAHGAPNKTLSGII